jgi:hypothetical protein
MKSKKINRINKKKYKTFKKKGGNPDGTTNGNPDGTTNGNQKKSARNTNPYRPTPSNPFGFHSPFNKALLTTLPSNSNRRNNSPQVSTPSPFKRSARAFKRKSVNPEFDFLEPLIKNFKVFVWDFDDTIVSKEKAMQYSKHNGNILQFTDKAHLSMDPALLASLESNSSKHPTAVQNLFFEPKEFVDVTLYLISHGCSVYIASFGLIDNIVAILGMLYRSYGKTSPFNRENANVYGLNKLTTEEKVKWRSKKKPFLKDILDKNQGYNILFFDDNHENINANLSDSNIYGIKLGKDIEMANTFKKTGFHIDILEKIVSNLGRIDKTQLSNICFT